MKKNIIHIFGPSGSGTSTLGKYVSEQYGYTFMDTDDYFWLPTNPKYTTKRPVDERIQLMKETIEKADHVVISGSLVDWGDPLIPLFTVAVRLETKQEIRKKRLIERESKAFGSRIEKGGDMYQTHIDFINWAMSYETGDIHVRSKAKHDQWQKLLTCPLIELDGASSIEENIKEIKKHILPLT